MRFFYSTLLSSFLCMVAPLAAQAQALSCSSSPEGFRAWLPQAKAYARSSGISAAVAGQLDGLTYASAVIKADRNQGHFRQSFETFSAGKITGARLAKGRSLLKTYRSQLAQLQATTGVPAEVIIAIWGLETDYGVNMGKMPVIRSLATLAYDCRRSEKFTQELIAALKIIQRGDIAAARMRGAWAGEIGQAQFLASNYLRFATDGDGDGRRDLVGSRADVIASIANYLRGHGWQAGAGYQPNEANFAVLQAWNAANVYARTIAAFAARL